MIVGFITVIAVGCKPDGGGAAEADANATQAQVIPKKDLPALRVGVVDTPLRLQQTLARQWGGVTEQRIAFVPLDTQFVPADPDDTDPIDVFLVPVNALGTLYQKELVAPLPAAVADRAANSAASLSVRWDGEVDALPLSITLPSIGIDESLQPDGRDVEVAINAESSARLKLSGGEDAADEVDLMLLLATVYCPSEQSLTLLSPLNARSQLNQPWWQQAAKDIAQLGGAGDLQFGWPLAERGPIGGQDNPEEGAPAVAGEPADANIAWSPLMENSGPAAVDTGRGLCLVFSARSRQSASSSLFLNVVSDPEPLKALDAIAPTVLSPSDSSYDRLQSKLLTSPSYSAPPLLRFNRSSEYRSILLSALRQLRKEVAEGGDAPVLVTQTIQTVERDWEKLTDEIGRSRQEDSVRNALSLQ